MDAPFSNRNQRSIVESLQEHEQLSLLSQEEKQAYEALGQESRRSLSKES